METFTKPSTYILLEFYCRECSTSLLFYPDIEDPTTGSGACKLCGSDHWIIKEFWSPKEEE